MPGTDPIDFYFDFSSPYGYFAAEGLEDVVKPYGRSVRWHPVLIGVAMKRTGAQPLANIPVKGDYMTQDCNRLARFMNVPWCVPPVFPVSTADAARAFYAIDHHDQEQAKAFAKGIYRSYFGEGLDITDASLIQETADQVGANGQQVISDMQTPAVKDRLRKEINDSIDRGVFGSPFVIVDGEAFWGSDRFWMIKRWLKSGGW